MSATINSIPASYYVSDIPSVIGPGGTGIKLVELMLTTNIRIPIGAVYSFPTLASVQAFFGATAIESIEAAVYFAGFDGSTIKPGALLFTQYNTANVGAYLRGGNISTLTLTQLQAIGGVLTVTIDGVAHTSSTINLASATSFSNAAQLITTALGLTGPTQATITASMGSNFTGTATGTSLVVTAVTGTIHPDPTQGDIITGTGISGTVRIIAQVSGTTGGAGTYTTSASTTASTAAISATSVFLDVTAATGTIAIGQQVVGSGIAAGTYITALGTGTGGIGSYVTTLTTHQASEGMTTVTPTVTYDSVSGAFVVISGTTGVSSTISIGSGTAAAPLLLTTATGGILSQGAVAATPNAFMTNIVNNVTTDWISFQTLFDPDAGSGNTNKQLFAAWTNSEANNYVYLATDTDITPTQSNNATASLGNILKGLNSSGTVPIYQPVGGGNHLAAFLGGAVASIDFDATNGRTDLAYRSQSGLVPSVTNVAVAANLTANDYSFYAKVAKAGEGWQFWDNGSVTGPFSWLDSYVNQVWFRDRCVSALMTLLTTLRSIPYTPEGYGYIRQTLTGGSQTPIALPPASPVAEALNNGVIRRGVPLSAGEAVAVNQLTGQTVDGILSTQGWYLSIQPATASVRTARQSPTIILLYTDGQSIQRINLSSVLVQ